MPEAFRFDLSEEFPHLTRAPITEAVLEFRSRALAQWDEKTLAPQLRDRLPDYPQTRGTWGFAGEFEFRGAERPGHRVTDHAWMGIRAQSSDNCQIAQFNRDRFTFSRLAPYEDWSRFEAEALRLWKIHLEFAQPSEIQRIGVRFINQLSVPEGDVKLERYFIHSPEPPQGMNLPLVGFIHRETLEVPGAPYFVSVTKTTQTRAKEDLDSLKLVLDIDVTTRTARPIEVDAVAEHFPAMRWLKNKVFFGSFTDEAIEPLK